MKLAPCWLVSLPALIFALTNLAPTIANREHKVHNIVLYPNKQSWCTTRNISQVITEPGCKQVTIDNNVCVGACFSYSIPHTEPSDPGEVIGPYCDSCQPSNVSYEFVKVDCTESANAKSPYLFKQVQLIHNCSCTACEEQSTRHNGAAGAGSPNLPDTHSGEQLVHQHQLRPPAPEGSQEQEAAAVEQPSGPHHAAALPSSGEVDAQSDSDMIQDDIPAILEVVHYSENDTEPVRHTPVHDFQAHGSGTTYLQQQQLNHYEHNSHTDNVKKLLHQKISKLLRAIEETNAPADREQLIEMIRLIKGTSDRNWDELVESLQSENAILDFNRLRSELVEEEPLGDAAEDETGGDDDGDGDGDGDDDGLLAKQQHHSTPPETETHARSGAHRYDYVRHAHEHKPAAGSQEHPAAGGEAVAGSSAAPSGSGESGAAKQHQQQHQQQQHHHHAHHVVGERVDAHHHLERGPHGALVIRANEGDQEVHRILQNGHEIKEKINIHANELKPNHAGTIVTYGSHAGAPGAPDYGKPRVHEHHHHHQHAVPHHPHHHHVHDGAAGGHHGHEHGRTHEHAEHDPTGQQQQQHQQHVHQQAPAGGEPDNQNL